MKTYKFDDIVEQVKNNLIDMNYAYSPCIENTIKNSINIEVNPTAKNSLELLLENNKIAQTKKIPVCQDTGMVIAFVKIGMNVTLDKSNIKEAINESVRVAYDEGYLRKSVVSDPLFDRINTKDNTPAIIHFDIVDEDILEIDITSKGFGSENCSKTFMIKPSEGVEKVKECVIETVKAAGPNACPPLMIGVGIGGSYDYVGVLAKKALMNEIGEVNSDERYAKLEKELLDEINQLDIGPQGMGGKTTALNVSIEQAPTHIAGLPVGINISCHITRHRRIKL